MRKNMKRITLGVAAALLAVAVLAGCGDTAASEEETLARSTTTAASEENTAAGTDAEDAAGQTDETDADDADATGENGGTTGENDGAEDTTGTDEADSAEEQTTEATTQEAELTCALLFGAAAEQAPDGAGQLTARDTCTFVTRDYRDSLKDFYYAADSEQVYCVCIAEADSEETAAAILQEFNDTLESVQNDVYLTTDEQKVVKTAVTGSSGCYVWYLSLSEDSDVVKAAEDALKACLAEF